jgi:hypothetical protein
VASFGEEVAVVVGGVGAGAVVWDLREGDAGGDKSEKKGAEFHRAIRA